MRYTIELDTSTKELDTSTKQGTDILNQVKKVKGSKAVAIHKWKKLTSKDVALPGGLIPTEWQWEEYLNRKQGKGKPAGEALELIRKQLLKKYNV
jgi:hypothetical protein